VAAKRLGEERNTVSLSSLLSLRSSEIWVPALANLFWWAKAPCISQLHQLARSGAGPPDARTGGSPQAGMWQEAAARGDGDEAQPSGDHGSAPNAAREMALLLCDLLNMQLAQRDSHLPYTMGRLRSAMREKSSPLVSEKSWLFPHPLLFQLEALVGSHGRELEE